MIHDYCVIGGGIVGLATARELLRRKPGASLVLIEKEQGLAAHQTGHNSGVIHAGIYYAPGSFKAELCRRGAEATKEFCRTHGIAFEVCGKHLVATNGAELERMDALYERARANGVEVERIDAAELSRREPNISGLGALFVPSTGIVDYKTVCAAMAREIEAMGGAIRLGEAVTAIRETGDMVAVDTAGGSVRARRLAVCAGLQSDRLARLAGLKIDHRIVPFRGEYYRLAPRHRAIVNSLIYPVPDPEVPFLGVHLTRMIDGGVTVGPNAVVGFAREGYPRGSINLGDVIDYARFPGFWKTVLRYRSSAVTELRNSFWKRGYLDVCRRYCPSLGMDDLIDPHAGIRAQAVLADGTLVHDFLFSRTERMLHVTNAPSPAATSAITIGAMIADKMG